LLAMPSALMAQQNIQKTFDALLNDKITELNTRHIFERDPQTGRKSAQADVYDFVITDPSALECLKDIRRAFDKDKEAAYSLNSGSRKRADQTDSDEGVFGFVEAIRSMAPVALAVGDGSAQSVSVGTMKGSDYIYACFTDKDDPDSRYRYAYAMEWLEKSKKTQVRLAITYALRPEARDNSKGKKKHSATRIVVNGNDVAKGDFKNYTDDDRITLQSVKINGKEVARDGIRELIEDDMNSGSNMINIDSLLAKRNMTAESWLSEFNSYKRLFLKNPDGNTATHYATSIYSLCKKASMLEPDEKKLVVSELAKLKAAAKDELIQKIFEMSNKKLK